MYLKIFCKSRFAGNCWNGIGRFIKY
jgi:hypothetical protein